METGLIELPKNQVDLARKLDNAINEIVTKQMTGFERLFIQAQVVEMIRTNLTPEFMAPIMKLQNSKLGFLTDSESGYKIEIVKDCVIEALFKGFEVTGNHFNILAGKMYPTKAGLKYKLNKFPGLKYKIKLGLPKIEGEKSETHPVVEWTLNGIARKEILDVSIKVYKTDKDSIILGKVERFALAWLVEAITNEDSASVDSDDIQTEDISHVDVKKEDEAKKETESKKEDSKDKVHDIIGKTVSEEKSSEDSIPKEKSKKQLDAEKHLDKAKDLDQLERYNNAIKVALKESYDESHYLELKSNFESAF